MSNVTVITHPLVQHKLTLMRKKDASTNSFRRLLGELSTLMAYEVTRDMPLQDVQIETPLETMTGKMIDGKKLVLVSILRAGNGILDGVLSVVPGARFGHIGLYRDPQTLQAVEYYFKMPKAMNERDVIVVDPMLATGNSAAAAIARLKQCQPRSIKFLCLLTCPEGIHTLHREHPDVPIYTAAIDRELNDHGYILPGLGDAGTGFSGRCEASVDRVGCSVSGLAVHRLLLCLVRIGQTVLTEQAGTVDDFVDDPWLRGVMQGLQAGVQQIVGIDRGDRG